MKLVVIESPYAARCHDGTWYEKGVEKNLQYLRAAMRDCLLRGEAPYASHALYTQPGVLNDQVREERDLGMRAGFEFYKMIDTSVVYTDLGISTGMKAGITKAKNAGRTVEYRSLPDWAPVEGSVSHPICHMVDGYCVICGSKE